MSGPDVVANPPEGGLNDYKAALKRFAHGALEFNRPFTFYHPGFNVRPTDLNARLGLLQLQRVDEVVRRRVDNHRRYQARFASLPGFRCQRNQRLRSGAFEDDVRPDTRRLAGRVEPFSRGKGSSE